MGCSSPKSVVQASKTEFYIAEPINEHTTLGGVGLGWTVEQVKAFAKTNGYSTTWADEQTANGLGYSNQQGLYRPGTAITLIYDDESPRHIKEVILNAGWQDADAELLYSQAVRQFGFDSHTVIGSQGWYNPKNTWDTEDENIALEFWSDYRPKAPASLHLIDKRKLTPSDHSR